MKTRLALLLPLLALAGCRVDNNGSVYLAAICAPADETCSFRAACDAQFIGMNAVDVATTNIHWLMVEVHNQLPDNAAEDTNRTNTNDAFVQEYEVEYEGVALPTARGPVPGSAHVPANGTAVISVLPIDEVTGNALGTIVGVAGATLDIVAKVRLKGVYGDTTKFETGLFEVPIRVCRGCIGAIACTAPEVAAYCPQAGQVPSAAACVTP
jgi:hypothetical protein